MTRVQQKQNIDEAVILKRRPFFSESSSRRPLTTLARGIDQ